jgi:transposase
LADEQARAQVDQLAEAVQEITGENIELAYVDQGHTGENAAQAAEKHGVRLEVVKHAEVKRGFVVLSRRWVFERSFAWAARFRPLARYYECLAKTPAALQYLVFAILMLANLARQLTQS